MLARILLQDMAGFPALNDFAAMRNAAKKLGGEPARIEPLVPVDLVVDHSVEVDVSVLTAPDGTVRMVETIIQEGPQRDRALDSLLVDGLVEQTADGRFALAGEGD